MIELTPKQIKSSERTFREAFADPDTYENDSFGSKVSNAGDVNGDGCDDFIISAPNADHDVREGKTYLIFGDTAASSSMLYEGNLISKITKMVIIQGENAGDVSGLSISGAGDVNSDGYDDLLIGARYADIDSAADIGKTYLIFGQQEWDAISTVYLHDLGSNSIPKGCVFIGEEAYNRSGMSLSGVGDVNGDGYADFVTSSSAVEVVESSYTYTGGKSYLLFGQREWTNIDVFPLSDLKDDSIPKGFTLEGFTVRSFTSNVGPSGYYKWAASGAGDVNHDGYDDFLLGVPNAYGNLDEAGKACLVLGQPDWQSNSTFSLGELNSSSNPRGVVFEGERQLDQAGYSVSSAGDVDADGYLDFLIGAPGVNTGNSNVGRVYLLFGQEQWYQNTSVSLSEINSSENLRGLVFQNVGSHGHDELGFSVGSAGDVNRDGYSDFLIGSPGAKVSRSDNAGTSYLIFGQQTFTYNDTIVPSVLDGQSNPRGLTFREAPVGLYAGYYDSLGASVSNAGDVNRDGCSDFLIGAPSGRVNSTNVGKAYILLGQENWPGGNSTSTIMLGDLNRTADVKDFALGPVLEQSTFQQRRLLMVEERNMVSSSSSRLSPGFGVRNFFKQWDNVFQGLLYLTHLRRPVSESIKTQASTLLENSLQKTSISIGDDTAISQLPSMSALALPNIKAQTSGMGDAFDMGLWDDYPTFHSLTHKPMFTYRVFKSGEEVGSAVFYNHPLLCRGGTEQLRHNLLQTTGVLSFLDTLKTLEQVYDVCESLPPTASEQLWSAMQSAAGHGAIRGLAQLAQQASESNDSKRESKLPSYAYYLTYYGLWFGARLMSHYQALSEEADYTIEENTETLYQASALAAVDTASLAVTNASITGAGRLARWAGEQASQSGWHRTGNVLSWLGNHSGAVVFAGQCSNNGVVEAGARMVVGAATEQAVVGIGTTAMRFFKKENSPQVAKYPEEATQQDMKHLKCQ